MSSADAALQRAHAFLEDARDPTLDAALRTETLDGARAALLDARRARASATHLQPVFISLCTAAAADRSHIARAVVPQAVEDLCLRDLRAFVPAATPFLVRALQDSHVLVAARAVRALTTLFRKTIGYVVSVGVGAAEPLFPEVHLASWLQMQQKAVSLIHVQDEGLRKAAVKFAETVVLAFSYSGGPGSADHFTLDYVVKKGSTCPLLDPRALEDEGIRCVKSIAQLVLSSLEGNVVTVKPDGSDQTRGLPPASFMTAVSVLGNLVRRRRKIMEFTLPPFLSVVSAVVGTSQQPCKAFEVLTEGQRQSIIAVLRFNLAALRGYPHVRVGRVGVDITQATNDLATFEREEDARRKERATALAAMERVQKAEAAFAAEAEKRRAVAQAHPLPSLKRPRGADPAVPWPRLPANEAFALSQSIIQSMPPQEVVNFIMTRLLLNIPSAETVPGAQRANQRNRNGARGTAEEPAQKRPRKSRFGSKDADQATSGGPPAAAAKKSVVRKVAPPVVPVRLSAINAEKLVTVCCRRIMKRESRAISSGAGPLRIQLLARLLTSLAQKSSEVAARFCDEACAFIADDINHNMPLAQAWLFSLICEGEIAAIIRDRPDEHNSGTNVRSREAVAEPLSVKEEGDEIPAAEKPEPIVKSEPMTDHPMTTHDIEEGNEKLHGRADVAVNGSAHQEDATAKAEKETTVSEDVNMEEELEEDDTEPLIANAAYERVFTGLLERLKEKSSSLGDSFSTVVTEAPVLPSSAIALLKQFCLDPSRIKLGLHTLRDIVLKRPGNDRSLCLSLLLEFTSHKDEVLRGPAIRLVANKIFVEFIGDVPETVERYAISSLNTSIDSLSETPTSDEINRVERGSLLLTALCGQKHELLQEIASSYTKSRPEAKKVLLSRAKDLAAHLGMSAVPVIHLISATLLRTNSEKAEVEPVADGLEVLALEVLRAVLKKFGKPSQDIVEAAQRRYEISGNTDFIIAVLPGLKKEALLKYLAAIVRGSYSRGSESGLTGEAKPIVDESSKTAGFKDILTMVMSSRPPAMSPAELLIELHNIEPTAAVSSAIRACFELKSVYRQESIAQAVQQLIEKTVIPDLFMRTVHLARIFYPELEKYLTGTVMKRLIEKQVWKNELLWEGYLLYCAEVKEKSLKVLLSLPVNQLSEALEKQAVLRSLFKDLVSNPKNARKIQVKHRKAIAAAIKNAPTGS